MGSLFGIVCIALVVGWVARALHPRGRALPLKKTLLWSIVGSVAVEWFGPFLGIFKEGQMLAWMCSTLGAVAAVVFLAKFQK